jgi:hypothetical protein
VSKREWQLKPKDSPYTMTLSDGWKAVVDATGTLVTMTYSPTGEEAASTNMTIDPDPGVGKP